MKIFFLVVIGVLLSCGQYAYAKIIVLNNQNPDICRQQIIQAGDHHPVVLSYIKDCTWAKKVMPLYEQASNESPDRAFFSYVFNDDESNAYMNAKTAHDCLGIIPIRSPSFYMFNVFTGKMGMIFGEMKQGLDGSATLEDIRKFSSYDFNIKYTALKTKL